MSIHDASLKALPGEQPSGEDLRNNGEFLALRDMLQPRTQVSGGREQVVPVNWPEVVQKAEALLGVGRDLRLLIVLARALAQRDGMEGLATGLSMIARNLDDYWDSIHPQPRGGGDGPEAFVARSNALRDIEDDRGLIGELGQRVWVKGRGLGDLTGTDLAFAGTEANALDSDSEIRLSEADRAARAARHEQTVGRVKAVFAAVGEQCAKPETADVGRRALEEMQEIETGRQAAVAALEALVETLARHLPAGAARFPKLAKFLERFGAGLALGLKTAGADTPPPASEPAGEAAGANDEMSEKGKRPAAAAPGEIGGRDDVVRALDRIIAYYRTHEPSSPIPVMLTRVRSMVDMDFVQLLEEISPAGLKDFSAIAGIKPPASAQSKKEKQ